MLPAPPQVLALFTVRMDLLLLVLAALGTQVPASRAVQLIAARAPARRAGAASLATVLAPYHAPLVVYDVTTPYHAAWRALQEARSDGAVRDDRVVLLTDDKQGLEAAVGETAALEVHARALDAARLVRMLQRRLALGPRACRGARWRHRCPR